MLTIRLQRAGRKNQPVFRIVLAEKHRAATKKIVEQLGLYNPRNKDFSVKEERVKFWIEKHVQLSPTVHNLFVTKKLVEGAKVHAWQPRKTEKLAETAKPAETAAPAAPTSASAEQPLATPTAETPAPEVPTQA